MTVTIINQWFIQYDKWVNQAQRAQRLGIEWTQEDKILGVTYHSLIELDQKAEEMRQQSNELLAKWKKEYGYKGGAK